LHVGAAPTWMPRYLFYVCMVHSIRLSPFEHFSPLDLWGFPKPSLPSGRPNIMSSHSSLILFPLTFSILVALSFHPPFGILEQLWVLPDLTFLLFPAIHSILRLSYLWEPLGPCLVPFVPVRPFRFSSVSTHKMLVSMSHFRILHLAFFWILESLMFSPLHPSPPTPFRPVPHPHLFPSLTLTHPSLVMFKKKYYSNVRPHLCLETTDSFYNLIFRFRLKVRPTNGKPTKDNKNFSISISHPQDI
jgi:hypothetical protein